MAMHWSNPFSLRRQICVFSKIYTNGKGIEVIELNVSAESDSIKTMGH
jgi:hypothetical protein